MSRLNVPGNSFVELGEWEDFMPAFFNPENPVFSFGDRLFHIVPATF
jgi:hypothetical protein